MTNFPQNLRFAFRTLYKSPGFALTAIITLAIGIGANTAIFSVLNAVLLRPLPFHSPDKLMVVSESSPQFDDMSVAYQNYQDWQAQNSSFQSMAMFRQRDYTLVGDRGPEHVNVREVSAGFFNTLGAQPAMGRDFQPDEDREGSNPVAVLSYGLWQRRFGGDPNILGRSFRMSDREYTVIGVAAKDFWFFTPSDLYVAVGATGQPWLKIREEREGSRVVARLKPGVGLAQAKADLNAIAARLATAYPQANADHGVTITSMMDYTVSDVRGTLLLLFGAVAFLLLIACVNVANLLLGRVIPRQRELAVRMALGASRARVATQLLTESVLLALMGGLLGIGLAWAGTRALLAAVPHTLPRSQNVGVDWRVGIFLLLLCLLTGVLFGLAPVWQSIRGSVNATLKEGSRGSTGGRNRLQNVLVVAELALALVLLVGAGLTVRTLVALGKVDPGFRSDNVLTFSIKYSKLHYNEPQKVRSLFRDVTARLQNVPGVEAATLTTDVMMRDDSEVFFYVAERPKPAPKDFTWSMMYVTGPEYLRTMGVQQLKGRFYTENDNLQAANVIVIDEELARSTFPGQDPIGQHLIIPFPGFDQPREVIGIVRHVRHWGLAQDATAKIRSEFYIPFAQVPDKLFALIGDMTFAVRSHLKPDAITAATKNELRAIDPDIPLFNVDTMDEIIRTSIARERFTTLLFALFAGAALLLGAIGTYGVLSYSVTQRTHEMGIRAALGAGNANILGLVLGRGLTLIATGVGIGLLTAFALSRLLSSMLYGVKSTDPVTFLGVAMILTTVAIAACYVPARRATKVDPIIALRYE